MERHAHFATPQMDRHVHFATLQMERLLKSFAGVNIVQCTFYNGLGYLQRMRL